MYRLSKIFASDITAGGNLLRNAYVPVFREDGRADHGVLFAANGTCKTTLLSFILSVFCPARQRFVQHLQSGGDKTMEQYLIPGRPALVLLDLATVLQPTLFEAEPVDHLVLGQLLYRHRSMPDKTERTFFIAQSADFFDELRGQWDELLGREQPYRSVRDFMIPRIQQTTSQKEWADKLAQLGLDPWLIDRQIDFARTEGGIKDAFKFRSEVEFLSFFLGCVADMEAAVTLRERMEQDLRKMQDRPRKLNQLKAARNLKERIADFDTVARKWRSAGRAIEIWHEKLGEATHLLQAAHQAAEAQIRTLTPTLAEAESQHQAALSHLETTRSNMLEGQRLRLSRDMEAQEKQLRGAVAETGRLQAEATAIEAADFMADIRATRAQAQNKQEALVLAGEEMAPMQRKVDGLAAQYHVRLDADRRRVEEAIGALQKRQSETAERQRAIEERRAERLAQQAALDKELSRFTSRIQEAEANRFTLAMEPGEDPANAQDRLRQAMKAIDGRLTGLRGQMATLDEAMRVENSRWRTLQAERSKGEAALARARERTAAQAEARARLQADPHLARVAGTAQVEVTSAELVSKLDDAIARTQTRLTDTTRQCLKLEQELERLERTETLAADDQTQQLIAHYRQAGIAPGDLKSYPEYLANLYETPERIALFIEGDPARFTGIMAATEAVIETVRNLPVPSWLHRPVVISTPCPPEAVTPIAQTVIRPVSPQVYSKHHMAQIKAQYQTELDTLKQEIEKSETLLRGMEKSSRALHRYREKYPDRAAVAALADRVKALETTLAKRSADIDEAEARAEFLRERKTELENQYRHLGNEAAWHAQRLQQVATWLGKYESLGSWRQEAAKMRQQRVVLEKNIRCDAETLANLREEHYRIAGDIREQEIRLKGLDDRAGDVLRPREVTLAAAERKAALSMDLNTLRRLHEAAREDQRQLANQLGIDLLRKELEALCERIAQRESRFRSFQREHFYSEKQAEGWAVRDAREREDHRQTMNATQARLTETRIRLETDLKHLRKEMAGRQAELADRAAKGLTPDLAEAEIADQDMDSLLHRLRSEAAGLADTCDGLARRCHDLQDKQKLLEKWYQEIRLGLAENQAFAPLWDETSPRCAWPDLLGAGMPDEQMAAIRSLREAAEAMAAAEKEDRRAVEAAQRKLRSAFDRFQVDLQGEAYKHHLPTVVDELRSHDAESLGAQARDLIQRCEDIARNFETDLEITQRFMDSLVDMLLQHSREYHQKLQAAAREVLPEDVFIYGGKPILRAGTHLDFAKRGDVFRQSVENWLYELMQQDRLPEVNPRVGNCLGAELLYQLLGAASGKQTFGIRLLKCDDTGRNYEPVGKDLGSGGEALTIAVLLYALLISMRKKRHGSSDGRIPAFLVLDNPLGVCNRSDFLDTQLKVARGMGLQCVYLTGINDRESLDLFELRVAIRKGDKKLEIDHTAYDCLEVTELNVEKQA
jgi:hypothetical protein